ncbi:hypothetical protein VTL71DRAFT_16377 [Oculimacula yallundae]|uniref:Heterokaryon incompatibility domain-containing protein n=1 Tax=Oculimacula yallundae TaxID=86028 RepID=A0ABR4CE85_9HELO
MVNESEITTRGSPIYTLSSLPQGDWTRVLVLAPGTFEDQIVCSLQLHDLNDDSADSEPYEALSYVWGNASQKHEIQVNGHVMEITSNLFTALQQLRSSQTPRRIWADAICINQSDLIEKGRQVNNMGKLYAAASQVIVWLGPDEKGEAGLAIKAIKKFNGLVEKQLTPQQPFSGWGALDDPLESLTSMEVQHAVALFDSPWFTRVWVIQEVGVAARVLLAWGSVNVDFVEVIQFVCSWNSLGKIKQNPIRGHIMSYVSRLFSFIWASYIPKNVESFEKTWFNTSEMLQYEARHMRVTQPMEFEDIMYSCRVILRATDSRDFVYAFLGHPIATLNDGTPLLNADYTIDEAALRLRVFLILSQRSLRFLGLVWHAHQVDLTNAPSWCPNFGTSKYASIGERFNASKGLSSNSTMTMLPPTVETNGLTISALLVDEIHLCGEVAGTTDDDHILTPYTELLLLLNEVVERYWALAEEAHSQLPSAYIDTDRPMAFASTLIAAFRKDDEGVVAKHFVSYCREHCPSIHAHLQREWRDKWKVDEPGDEALPVYSRAASMIYRHRFFTTMKGSYGTGSPLVQPGDLICIIPGVRTPCVIRRVDGEKSKFQIVCSCYVYGLMYGNAVRRWEDDPASARKVEITLV